MAERKFRHMLISRYKKLANEKKLDTNINSHVEQWAADSLIESYTLDICYEMLEYYFKVSDSPSWKWFSNNADKIYKNLQIKAEDDRIRQLMREKAKEWLK